MKRLLKKTEGFTLIELLIVMVILAILLAIAIPTYLAFTKQAKDTGTKQYLNVAWKAYRAAAVTSGGSFPSNTAGSSALVKSDLTTSEPYLTPFIGVNASITGTSGSNGCTYINAKTGSSDKVILIGKSSGAATLYLYDRSSSGRVYALYSTDRSATTGISTSGPTAYSLIKTSC